LAQPGFPGFVTIMPVQTVAAAIMLRCSVVSAVILAVLSACTKTAPPIWEAFSGEKALAHVQVLVNFGPRPSGSEALAKSRDYIQKQLESFGWETSRQSFTDNTPKGRREFVNLIARFGGKKRKSEPIFLLCSHYDTKLFENMKFVGADDGGSSTGLLLEIARVLAQRPELAEKVELVFFDGEEAIEHFSDTDGIYGSRYFARELTQSGAAKRFRGGLLFDMVGDRSLDITLPLDSPVQMAHDLFASAAALKVREHFTYFDGNITDDHTPLNAIGIPTVDVIDFDFPWWHTAEDTMDKLSAQSLQTVGRVGLYYLSRFALK
jgi:Peptidase family M28